MTAKNVSGSNDIDVKRLLEILPKLIRENDTVKGAILTALSGVVATRDDIKDLIHEMDKRFEQVEKRFEAMQAQMDKRFEQVEKRFDAMQAQMDKRFDAMQAQMDKRFEHVDKRLDQIAIGADVSFELFCIEMIKKIFAAEGHPIPYIEQRRHFTDVERMVNEDTTDVEIDLYYQDPPVIGEVTYRADSIEKLDKFLSKIAFMEHDVFKGAARRYFCTLEIEPSIHDAFQKKAKKHQVEVITKQQM
jgi:hypothetical protein